MNRTLIFPAIAVTAWAQQPSPAAVEAEAAVRARAQEFFQLQVDKKYRQAEAFVAEDTKDDYYNGARYNIKSFSIEKVELRDGDAQATVTLKAKATLTAAQIGAVQFEIPIVSLWKIEEGKWVWYREPVTAVQTPFGTIHPTQPGAPSSQPAAAVRVPNLADLQNAVKIDRNSISLTEDAPLQTVTVTNGLPGAVDLELTSDRIPGLSAELEKKHLDAGEKTVIRFRATDAGKASGVVRLKVSPLAQELDIQANLN